MAGTWLESKSGTFFWQNFRSSARKSVFCYRTPDFVNGPFVALGDSFDLAPADPFLNFSFPSYGNFREGDPPTQQKVLPHLTVGALTDSNSPSARSALALRARAGQCENGQTLSDPRTPQTLSKSKSSKIREVSSLDFLSETLTCVCLGATVRLWKSCYGLHAPVRFAYRYCIFRCSLPKAMSISRSEILRKKEKRTRS